MAFEQKPYEVSILAGADLSALQYTIVALDGSGHAVGAGAGDKAIGILQDKPAAASRPALVAVGGISKVRCGGTISAGAQFSVTTGGLALAVAAGTDTVVGYMLEAATTGTIRTCMIQVLGPTA